MRPLAFLLIAAAVPASALPAPYQDLPSLDRAVAAFTGHGVGEEGGPRTPVDPRLRLAQCPTVSISWRTPAEDAVVVSCSGPSWRLFVPVLRATPKAVPAALAPRPAVAVKAEPVIRRGDPVVIEAEADGFAISREGVAMADAAPGGRVAVKVDGARPNAGSVVQAVALEAGRATLPGWTR
jgi:flagellar basal body P-ring formation protein FlgA